MYDSLGLGHKREVLVLPHVSQSSYAYFGANGCDYAILF
jgi:hypothetical protein